ncbi:uncharacterized protein LOC120260768 [Dioscorea cayenensis subsp. rotundata]|uniref:Uncharacterized protein LOC120260768 n=1 Tax=Dioscorea cayennensis subsp. rotundata TaxID=55577 RepID=A0AB40BCA8_DIOCR|nr:uncharacterized protein LOC120260768 [Dioscorea cayenensis subsp. rotundata]
MTSKANWSLQADENSLLLFFFIFFFVVVFTGLCVTALLRKKNMKNSTLVNNDNEEEEEDDDDDEEEEEEEEEGSGWERTRKMLARTLRWSEATRWQNEWAAMAEMRCNSRRDEHRNAMASPLWKRRILMGEKCELPRFSGVILYDEHGFPLRDSPREEIDQHSYYRDEPVKVLTTLKDLL